MSDAAMRTTDRAPAWNPRAARASDAATCAPLIYASGRQEFDFLFCVTADRIVAFLNAAFRSDHGRFSWRRHYVAAAPDGTAVGILGFHHGWLIRFDDMHLAWMLLRKFGVAKTVAILWRGLALKRELPAPARTQIHVTHCAVRPSMRGFGVFTALFQHTLPDAIRAGRGGDIVIDVLASNDRAGALYRQLGFEDVRRSAPVSSALPPELKSIRLRLGSGASESTAVSLRKKSRKTYP